MIPLTFKPGVRVPDLTMPVFYPSEALKSRRARARFRKQHHLYVKKTWKEVRTEIQRQGGIPGRFRYQFLEPIEYHVTTFPAAPPYPDGDVW